MEDGREPVGANPDEIRDDGVVLGPDSLPVTPEDLPYIVQRLESGARLKALLQINIILNLSEGEKKLTPEERARGAIGATTGNRPQIQCARG